MPSLPVSGSDFKWATACRTGLYLRTGEAIPLPSGRSPHREGFETLRSNGIPLKVDADETTHQIDISQPEELRRRLKKHPEEINANASGSLSLTTDRKALNREIIRYRRKALP